MHKRSLVTATAALSLAFGLLAPVLPAQAQTVSAHHYSSCAEVHRVYSGGIAKAGVNRNRVSGHYRALRGHVKHSTALYNANRRLDRDRDGVACEAS
jgi:hypothetical protein